MPHDRDQQHALQPRVFSGACTSLLVLFALSSVAVAQGKPRLHRQGPISFREFLAAPPAESPLDALTTSHLKYDYRYRLLTKPNGATTLTLSGITFRAEFLPEKSWSKLPQDMVLLKHEQGHFDITEVMQRKAAAEWRGQIGKLSVRAATKSEGEKQFDALIRKRMEPYFQRLIRLQIQYDSDTKHGRDVQGQKRWAQLLAQLLEDPDGALPLAPEPAPAPGLDPPGLDPPR